ncbi:hypothetical protein GCM10027176_52570 [Actinoallomurus bryophytorum]|uniref:Uncharacterized protein n=1 Tax=Actinoallomurus bryophytorum TaxID=1490222 RepID=A0A543CHD3_9ACTN|nr:hypothetical protein [Actinoallomurus bryophytorum]TQL96513.1 hypothetical protein FB559_2045 [Actinoallomurus bryophytorum]
MTGTANLRYGWVLALYPRSYRAEHGQEILATLAEATGPDRRVPPLREIGGLLSAGALARVRATADGAVSWWADGIHLGVFVLALLAFAPNTVQLLHSFNENLPGATAPFYPAAWFPLLPLVISVALMRGWVWVALPPAVVMAVQYGRYFHGRSLLPSLPDYGPDLFNGTDALPPLLIVAGLLVLAARGRRPLRHRSWLWWSPVLLVVLGQPVFHWWADNSPIQTLWWPQITTMSSPMRGIILVIQAAMFLLTIWATKVTGDLRWALATAVYLATVELSAIRNIGFELAHPDLMTATVVGTATGLLAMFGLAARRTRKVRASADR